MSGIHSHTATTAEPHSHDHHHHHHQPIQLSTVNTAFVVGICLNFLFVIIEVIAGFRIHSLSLLSDAGHNMADVGALALSLLAFKLLKVKSSDNFTYGFRKTSILVALFNAMILLLSIGAIAYEAVNRLIHPQPLPGKFIAIIAAIGILINFSTARLFHSSKDHDLNMKSAYLHLMSDAVVSLALVIGGIIIIYTQWYWIDSILSLIVAFVILFSTWRLLKDSLRLSLDGVPAGIDMQELRTAATEIPGIKDFHHIHVWAISTTEVALTAHVVINDFVPAHQVQGIKSTLKHMLEHKNIHHITLETERENHACEGVNC